MEGTVSDLKLTDLELESIKLKVWRLIIWRIDSLDLEKLELDSTLMAKAEREGGYGHKRWRRIKYFHGCWERCPLSPK